jgi:hypothetical protein
MLVALDFDAAPAGIMARDCRPGWYQGHDGAAQVMLVLPGAARCLLFREGAHVDGGTYAPIDGVPGLWMPLTRKFTLTVNPWV